MKPGQIFVTVLFLVFSSCSHMTWSKDNQEIRFQMNRAYDDIYDQLLCVMETDQSNKTVSSVIEISITDFTDPSNKVKLASASTLQPDNSVHKDQESIMQVTGNVSQYQASLEIRLNKENGCILGTYLCEVTFVDLAGSLDRYHAIVEANLPDVITGKMKDYSDLILSVQMEELRKEFVDTVKFLNNRCDGIEEGFGQLKDRMKSFENEPDPTPGQIITDGSDSSPTEDIPPRNQQSDADRNPVVETTPPLVDAGLTDSLDVTCSFEPQLKSIMAALLTLSISRYKSSNKQDITDLANINEYSQNKVNLLTTEGLTATGVFNSSGQSSIHLHWEYPEDMQGGMYQCSTQGFDSIGHVIVMTDVAQVIVRQPSFNALKLKVQELDLYTKKLENNLGKRISVLETEKQKRFSQMFENESLTYQGHTYYVSKIPYTDVFLAIAVCRSYGGYLAEINNAGEHHALQTFLNSVSDVYTVVISGTDEEREGTWVYHTNRQRLSYIAWAPGDPAQGTRDNCLRLSFSSVSSKWLMYDTVCHFDFDEYSYRFMCEVP